MLIYIFSIVFLKPKSIRFGFKKILETKLLDKSTVSKDEREKRKADVSIKQKLWKIGKYGE